MKDGLSLLQLPREVNNSTTQMASTCVEELSSAIWFHGGVLGGVHTKAGRRGRSNERHLLFSAGVEGEGQVAGVLDLRVDGTEAYSAL